jgi:DNA-binding MarR family transcriptional regulator
MLSKSMIDDAKKPTATVPAIHQRPAHLARRFNQLCQALIAEALEEHGLTNIEYPALATLAEEPGIDQRRLAEAIGIDRNSVGQLVATLERRGLILRTVDAQDRRARVLHLSTEGRAARDRTRPRMLEANARILEPLAAWEREALLALLLRVVHHHESRARPGAGRRRRPTTQSRSEIRHD